METMRKASCDLSLSEPVFKDDSGAFLIHVTHPEGLPQQNDTTSENQDEENTCPTNSFLTLVLSIEEMVRRSRWNVLFTILKMFFACSYGFCEFLLDMVLSKWLWNVIWVTSHVLIDVFLHLVLAVSAIMVTIIINMDGGCRRKEEDLLAYAEYEDDDEYEDEVGSNSSAINILSKHGLGDTNQLPSRMKSR